MKNIKNQVNQQTYSSRMRVIYHNWSATKQHPHPQSLAEISRHSVLSGDRIRQCETSSGSRHKDTDQCLIVAISFCSLHLPKSFNFVNAFACYKQKGKLAPFNLAHPVYHNDSYYLSRNFDKNKVIKKDRKQLAGVKSHASSTDLHWF